MQDAVRSHLYLARVLNQLGLLSLAAQAYRDAFEADPASFEACFGMGEALARGGHWATSVSPFQAAAALRSTDVESQGNLVLALYRSGNVRAAASAMRRLIDLRPGEPELHLALGVIQCRMRHPAEAMRSFRWAAQLGSPVARKQFLLGEALFGERQWRDALRHLGGARSTVHLRPSARPRREARIGGPRSKPLTAILETPIRPPAAVSAALCGLAAYGHLLVARAFARRQPERAIRSVRAAHRLGAAAEASRLR